jgi:hypothetical protein
MHDDARMQSQTTPAPTRDRDVEALLDDYIGLYRGDTLERWRTLFVASFVASAANADGTVTSWTLSEFYERQRRSFATGKPIREVLEDVEIDRDGPLAAVRSRFVWSDGEVTRHGRLMLLAIADRGSLRIQSLLFSYAP